MSVVKFSLKPKNFGVLSLGLALLSHEASQGGDSLHEHRAFDARLLTSLYKYPTEIAPLMVRT